MSWLHLGRDVLDLSARVGFRLFGAWSWVNGPRPHLPLLPNEARRILVVRMDLLGDVVFSIPAIEALATAFPKAQIDVLTLPFTAPVLERLPSVRDVLSVDINRYRRPRGWLRIGELWQVVRELRLRRYDLAIGLSRRLGGVFAALSGARIRVGYEAETYRGCYNTPVPGGRYTVSQHEVEYCLDLVRALGVFVPSRHPLIPPTASVNGADKKPTDAERLILDPYVVLVPGASNGTAKRWPTPYWSRLADSIGKRYGLHVALSGAPSERSLLRAVADGISVPHSDFGGRTTTEELLDLLAGARLVVAGDTGPLHVASALGTPAVGIFGPTDPVNTGPRSDLGQVVRLGLACSPCYDLRTPADCKLPDRSAACMWGLPPEMVVQAVDRVLGPRSTTEASPDHTTGVYDAG